MHEKVCKDLKEVFLRHIWNMKQNNTKNHKTREGYIETETQPSNCKVYQPNQVNPKKCLQNPTFFLTKIRQLSGILKRKTQQCDTFFNFVVFCCFGSKMFASSVFRDQILAVQSKSPTATSRLSASRNGTGDLRETLQNLREA